MFVLCVLYSKYKGTSQDNHDKEKRMEEVQTKQEKDFGEKKM
jgi:hypothetical protein